MDGMQLADWTYRVVVFIGGGGLLVWMQRTINAMRTTVQTQGATIQALEGLLQTMERIFKSTDERTMLDRLEAHKRFVEHEGEAKAKQLAAKFEADTRELQAGHSLATESMTKSATALIQFATNVLPYVPKTRRVEFIDSLELTNSLVAVKTGLHEIAQTAPDLSPSPPTAFENLGRFPFVHGALRQYGVVHSQLVGQELLLPGVPLVLKDKSER